MFTNRFNIRNKNKYFNIIERAPADAAEEWIRVPIEARSMTADAFDQFEITIETRWGLTPAIIPDKGYVQGSRGASEQPKPEQSPILNLRANSLAFYVTFGGIINTLLDTLMIPKIMARTLMTWSKSLRNYDWST